MGMFSVLIVIGLLSDIPVVFGQTVETTVTDVTGEIVTIGSGSVDGVVAGMIVEVVRRDEPVIHPLTHEMLGTPMVPVCTIFIGEVKASSAVGRIAKRYMRPIVGDRARFQLMEQEKHQAREFQPRERGQQKERSQAQRQTSEGGIEFSSEEERAQFLEALKATYEFAKLSRDVKAMAKLSKRIAEVERSLVEQRKQIGAVETSLKSEIALVRDDVAMLKNEIILLQTKFEDMKKTITGTGTSLTSRDPELMKPHPVEQQTYEGMDSTQEVVAETTGGRQASPREPAPLLKKQTARSTPWYLHWFTWSIVIIGGGGSGIAIFLFRRFRRKETMEVSAGDVEVSAGDVEVSAESVGVQETSPKKKRRVEFSPKEDGGDSTTQPDGDKDVEGGGKEDALV